jgi:hypothetical protein
MSNISRRLFLTLVAVVAGLGVLGGQPTSASAAALPATGSIQGTVADAHGHASVGAQVRLVDSHHHVIATTFTNWHGAFHFHHVAPGHYTLQASGPHKTHGSAGVDVHAGHTSVVHIVLQ